MFRFKAIIITREHDLLINKEQSKLDIQNIPLHKVNIWNRVPTDCVKTVNINLL